MKTNESGHEILMSTSMTVEKELWHEVNAKAQTPAIVRGGSDLSPQEYATLADELRQVEVVFVEYDSTRSILEPPGHDAQFHRKLPLSSKHSPTESTEALTSLRAEIRVLHELRKSDQQMITALAEKVRQLEVELMPFLEGHEDGEEVVVDAHYLWIEAHLDELRKYANRWVAIDPLRGIVADAANDEDLADKLDVLPAEEQARLRAIDASRYL